MRIDHPPLDAAVAGIARFVADARAAGERVAIRGGGTRHALCGGDGAPARSLELAERAALVGVLAYQPEELVITAGAATPLADLEAALAERGQMLPFEPPRFGPGSTLGGAIASGLSGPRRPWAGSLRDALLGVRMVNGLGEDLAFGGQVVKNVAGYDLSRLQAGAWGRFGVLACASIKVLPLPRVERTRRFELDVERALAFTTRIGRTPVPVSATWWQDGLLHVRVSGSHAGVADAERRLGGESADAFRWDRIRDGLPLALEPPAPQERLWRIVVPASAPLADGPGRWRIEWGGALRWLVTERASTAVMADAAAVGGHARPWGPAGRGAGEDPVRRDLVRRLAAAFDPEGVFAGQPGETLTPQATPEPPMQAETR